LRHLKGQLAQAGKHGFGFEAVGVIPSVDRALVGLGTQELGAFDLAGFIDKDAQSLASALQSVLKQEGINRFQRVGFDTHCHGRFSFLEVMASCRRRAVFPGGRPGRYAPAPPARQTFLPAVKTEFTERKIHNSGHGAMGLDNQALAGAMKPNLCVEQDLLSGGFFMVETP
jgi:hypothetical protein